MLSDFAMSNEIKENTVIHSNDEGNQDSDIEQPEDINQSVLTETEQEKMTNETSIDDEQDIETQVATHNELETSSELSSTEISAEKQEDLTTITVCDENSSALPIPKENDIVVDTIQSQSSNQMDDTRQLLRNITDKTNKEANLMILNTV